MAEVELPSPDEMHERAADPFARTVALFVAVYAVGLAIAAFGGHNAAKEMMMAKQEESNQWTRYQAKATREALYRNEITKLDADKDAAGGTLPPAKQKLLERYLADEARMVTEKTEIADGGPDNHGHGARHYQAEVRLMQRKDPYFDFAEVAFQVAIVLASVAMLSGKRWAFAASLVLAGLAALLVADGFLLLVAVPGLDIGPAATH